MPAGLIYGGIALIVLLLAGGAYLLLSGGDDNGGLDEVTNAVSDPTVATDDTTATTVTPTTEAAGIVETVPCDTSGGFLACINDVTVDSANNAFVVDLDTDFTAANGSTHYHFFLNPPTTPDNAGQNGNPPGSWMVYFGGSPAVVDQSNQTPSDAVANGSTELCVRAANGDHTFIEGTGNCVSIADLL